MAAKSKIEWTEATWNPVVGCSKVSEGCRNCYAMAVAARIASTVAAKPRVARTPITQAYCEVVRWTSNGDDSLDHEPGFKSGAMPLPQWNNQVRCIPERLDEPLRWRKPRMVFVNSMSDLFHPDVPFEFVDKVFAMVALCPRHTFQILTKRPERMAEYLNDSRDMIGIGLKADERVYTETKGWPELHPAFSNGFPWPLPNVWLGVSCEDQETADDRVPHLLRCPAAVRFLSCEPLLGEIDLWGARYEHPEGGLTGAVTSWGHGVDWVIVGGESGRPNARPCNVAWIRSIVAQCKAAGVPCFVKQLGARPCLPCEEHRRANWGTAIDEVRSDAPPDTVPLRLRDSKGGDPAEWPEDLRVREWPAAARVDGGDR